MIFVRSFLIAGIIALAFGYSLSKFFGFWEATVLAFVTCLATSPNNWLDFLVTPALCIVDNVGSFSNTFSSNPTFTLIHDSLVFSNLR